MCNCKSKYDEYRAVSVQQLSFLLTYTMGMSGTIMSMFAIIFANPAVAKSAEYTCSPPSLQPS